MQKVEKLPLILEDALGVNYVFHPNVKGTVTVQMPNPINSNKLFFIFGTILDLMGAKIVSTENGLYYEIVPLEHAVATASEIGSKLGFRVARDLSQREQAAY